MSRSIPSPYASLAYAAAFTFAACAVMAQPLTLDQCVQIAMQSNTDVISAGNSVKISKSKSSAAMADYMPQLTAQGTVFTGSTGVLGAASSSDAALAASINIYDGGFREERVIQARHGVTLNAAELTRTRQTVEYTVSKNYFELLRARELAEVAKSNVSYNEALQAQILAKANEGAAADVDVLPIDAQAASARVSLLSANNSIKTAAITLQNSMGLSSQSDFNIAPVGDLSIKVPEKLEACTDTALAQRPELTALAAAAAQNKSTVREAKLSMLPIPTITGTYQSQITGDNTMDGGTILGKVSLNIFDGGSNQEAYKQAQLGYNNSVLQLEQQKRDIRAEVEQSYLTLVTSQQAIDAAQLSLKSAQRNYDAQKDRYDQGVGTTLDLVNAETQLVSAQSAYVQARYDFYIASIQLSYVTGELGAGESNEKQKS